MNSWERKKRTCWEKRKTQKQVSFFIYVKLFKVIFCVLASEYIVKLREIYILLSLSRCNFWICFYQLWRTFWTFFWWILFFKRKFLVNQNKWRREQKRKQEETTKDSISRCSTDGFSSSIRRYKVSIITISIINQFYSTFIIHISSHQNTFFFTRVFFIRTLFRW